MSTTTTTETTASKNMSEKEIRDIVRMEIMDCFKIVTESQKQIEENQRKMGDDMLEIKIALLGSGNKYKTEKGLAEMIRISYDYVETNIKNRVMDRANPTMEHYLEWEENGNWKALEEIILNNVISNKMKLFFGLGSWAGIIAFISSMIVFIGWLEGWFIR